MTSLQEFIFPTTEKFLDLKILVTEYVNIPFCLGNLKLSDQNLSEDGTNDFLDRNVLVPLSHFSIQESRKIF